MTGYRKTKAALQEEQRINAAITSTLAAQASNTPAEPAVTPPRVFQTKTVQIPVVPQVTQIKQEPPTPGVTTTPRLTPLLQQ